MYWLQPAKQNEFLFMNLTLHKFARNMIADVKVQDGRNLFLG